MYNILGHKKIFLSISGFLCLISLIALIIWGLKPGIDFTGGNLIEVGYPNNNSIPSINQVNKILKPFSLGEKIQTTNNGFIFKFAEKNGKKFDEKTHQEILKALAPAKEVRFSSIGPIIGRELSQKAKIAIVLSLISIFLYALWAFRKLVIISQKNESWRFGVGAILALFHDELILLGFFAIFGHFKGVEINTPFIVALLTILGYSVNDSIVVYDRIRENLLTYGTNDLSGTINRSLNEILTRSLNTSITTLFVVFVIYLFGGATTRDFALAMMIGVIIGTWSSLFIASPFLLFRRKKIRY